MQLVEQPWHVIHVAVRLPVGIDPIPAVRSAVLLVGTRIEIAAPAPFLGTDDSRTCIDRFDHVAEVDHLLADFPFRRADRMHVAVRALPDAVFVVEDVELQAVACREAPLRHEVLHPRFLRYRAGRHARIVGIVAADVLAAAENAVTGIRKPLPIGILLRAIFRLREACELAAPVADLRDPVEHRDRDHRLRIARTTDRDEAVAEFAGRRTVLADAFEVPVVCVVGRIQLPVVARTRVAAVAIERRVEIVQGGGVAAIAWGRDAIDVGTDRMLACVGIDVDGDRCVVGLGRGHQQGRDSESDATHALDMVRIHGSPRGKDAEGHTGKHAQCHPRWSREM